MREMWSKIKEIGFKETIKDIFKNISDMISDVMIEYFAEHESPVLRFIITLLCEIEVAVPVIKDSTWRTQINTSDIRHISPPPEQKETFAQSVIPRNTFYCQGCPFYKWSRIARYCFGEQYVGYCYHLGKGDFSFIRPTDLLWDGCKCCGINEDIEEGDYEDSDEI